MKKVKIERYFLGNIELEIVKLVMEKEVKTYKNAPNAKEEEL